jgi:hypothetical protein
VLGWLLEMAYHPGSQKGEELVLTYSCGSQKNLTDSQL